MTQRFSRRTFVQAAALTAGASSVAAVGAAHRAELGDGAATAANDLIGVGVIGAGRRALNHVRRIARSKLPAKVVAIADAGARGRVQRFGKRDLYADYRRLLDRPDIDAIYIAGSPCDRSAQLEAVVAAGKHVYVDGPVFDPVRWRREREALSGWVHQTASRTDQVVCVGIPGLHDNRVLRARRLLKDVAPRGLAQVTTPIPKFVASGATDDRGLSRWTDEVHRRFHDKLAVLLRLMGGPNGAIAECAAARGSSFLPDLHGGRLAATSADYSVMLAADFPAPTWALVVIGTTGSDADTPDQLLGPGDPVALNDLLAEAGQDEKFDPSTDDPGGFLAAVRSGGRPFCNVQLAAATLAISSEIITCRRAAS